MESKLAGLNTRLAVAGHSKGIPIIGLGVYRNPPRTTKQAVAWALDAGYRHIDTAQFYENEAEVGEAIRESKIPREEIFVTTKMRTPVRSQGDPAVDAQNMVNLSLRNLGLDYIDLFLLHSPHNPDQRLARWRGLEQSVRDGKCRTIGVSNYGEHHMRELLAVCQVKPACNQIEVHTFLARRALVNMCQQNGVHVVAYSPIAKAQRLDDPTHLRIAADLSVSVPQVMLKWLLKRGLIILPMSSNRGRIEQNADLFSFDLSPEQMAALDGCDCHMTTGWDPTTMN